MISQGWRLAAELGAWTIALVWCVRTRTLVARLGEVPDLSEPQYDLCPARTPSLTVAVPARNEASTIGPAMETLLAQDYPFLHLLALDDRSTDATGALLDNLAQWQPGKLEVIHLTETAEGWLGKTFALEVATQQTSSEYLLFTDADVWFSPSILRRALAYAELSRADHLVVLPTAATKFWGERAVLGFLQVMALWGSRPWRVADPTARWDVVGAGAFNLIRRDALEELGGLAPQRLAVLEDVTLGRRVRAAGLRQRLAFAPGLVPVHWATGMSGIVQGMTKNLFALTNFQFVPMLFTMTGLVGLCLLPFAGFAWWPTLLPALITTACIAVHYRTLSPISGIDPRFGWWYPLGALAVLWAMVRSVVLCLWRGGVLWRDTLYPLRELRRHNSPLHWEFEAAAARAETRKAERLARPSRLLVLASLLTPRPPGRIAVPRTRRE